MHAVHAVHAERLQRTSAVEEEEGNDYFQQGFTYRWEKGKLSAGDVHQPLLERSRHVSRRAPQPEGVFTPAEHPPRPRILPQTSDFIGPHGREAESV